MCVFVCIGRQFTMKEGEKADEARNGSVQEQASKMF